MTRSDRQARELPEDPALARAVHRAKLELEQMIDLTPQAMVLIDADGRVTRANLAFLRLLRRRGFEGVLGTPLAAHFDGVDADFFAQLQDQAGALKVSETRAVPGDAAACDLRFTLVGIGGEAPVRVVLIEDVTRQKAQAQLDEKTHKRQAVQELAGALMHNVNQRLTVINVRAKMLLMALDRGDRSSADEVRKSLSDIIDLSMDVAGILGKLEGQTDYVTEDYVDGLRIVDLDKSKGSLE